MSLRLATPEDGAAIRDFIHHHWKRDHILARDKSFFDWQHLSRGGESLHFVVAEEDGEPAAILGWIPTHLYDADIGPERDVLWLTTWKVRPDAGHSGLGLSILSFLKRMVPHVAIATVGAAAKTLPLYRALGYQTGTLRHHFLVNEGVSDPCLMRLDSSQVAHPACDPGDLSLRLLVHDELVDPSFQNDLAPLGRLEALAEGEHGKTTAYFAARYLRHPVYGYQVYAMERGGRPTGLLATRLCEHGGVRALRLVDLLGPANGLAGGHRALQRLLSQNDAEYLDLYEWGLDVGALQTSGLRQARGETVIPNYFEPFVASNIPLHFAYKRGEGQEMAIFKGDGDQDRPT